MDSRLLSVHSFDKILNENEGLPPIHGYLHLLILEHDITKVLSFSYASTCDISIATNEPFSPSVIL